MLNLISSWYIHPITGQPHIKDIKDCKVWTLITSKIPYALDFYHDSNPFNILSESKDSKDKLDIKDFQDI